MSEEQFLVMMSKYAKANNTTIPWNGETCYLTPEQFAEIKAARKNLPSRDRVEQIYHRIVIEEELISVAARARSHVADVLEERLRTF